MAFDLGKCFDYSESRTSNSSLPEGSSSKIHSTSLQEGKYLSGHQSEILKKVAGSVHSGTLQRFQHLQCGSRRLGHSGQLRPSRCGIRRRGHSGQFWLHIKSKFELHDMMPCPKRKGRGRKGKKYSGPRWGTKRQLKNRHPL